MRMPKFLLYRRLLPMRSGVSSHPAVSFTLDERLAYSWTIAPKSDGLRINLEGASNSATRPDTHTQCISFSESGMAWPSDKEYNRGNEASAKRELPASNTRTRSLSMTVGIRCATLMTVHSVNSSRMIFWIAASVWESTEAVASSMKRIRLRFSMTRPKHRSCFCPTLQFSPMSATARNNNKPWAKKHCSCFC